MGDVEVLDGCNRHGSGMMSVDSRLDSWSVDHVNGTRLVTVRRSSKLYLALCRPVGQAIV
jgi:hypothetical protein